jgi:hypothetical protein
LLNIFVDIIVNTLQSPEDFSARCWPIIGD